MENCPNLNSAPCLESLDLVECTEMVEMITVEESVITNVDPPRDSFFPRFRKIRLTNIHNLKRICKQPLLFPSLKEVYVEKCQNLEKLRFEVSSVPRLEIV